MNDGLWDPTWAPQYARIMEKRIVALTDILTDKLGEIRCRAHAIAATAVVGEPPQNYVLRLKNICVALTDILATVSQKEKKISIGRNAAAGTAGGGGR